MNSYLSSCKSWVVPNTCQASSSSYHRPSSFWVEPRIPSAGVRLHGNVVSGTLSLEPTSLHLVGGLRGGGGATPTTKAKVDEADQGFVQEEEEQQRIGPGIDVGESVRVLKNAAKTRKVAAAEILSAFSVLEKAKLDPSEFLPTLGGSESPGRTWMLIFTAEKQMKGGRYFPITAVQRFDAAGMRIENGVFLGPIGCLTFEGRMSWKTRILAFVFERIRIKVGPLKPLEISLGNQEDREPSTSKDPFFIWFYVDMEIAVARGKSGGTAFWCRCNRVDT